jgi:hypothetical protein
MSTFSWIGTGNSDYAGTSHANFAHDWQHPPLADNGRFTAAHAMSKPSPLPVHKARAAFGAALGG